MRPEQNSRIWHLWGKNARDCGSLTGKRGVVSRKLKEPFPNLSKTILYTLTKASLACLCPQSSWSLTFCSHSNSECGWTDGTVGTVSRAKPTLHCPIPDPTVMTKAASGSHKPSSLSVGFDIIFTSSSVIATPHWTRAICLLLEAVKTHHCASPVPRLSLFWHFIIFPSVSVSAVWKISTLNCFAWNHLIYCGKSHQAFYLVFLLLRF